MQYLKDVLDFFLHLDKKIDLWTAAYGLWIYGILFLIIFVETGLVIMPILPGDSLLFVAGTLAAKGSLNLYYVLGLLFVAAFLGDTLNYLIGKRMGASVFERNYRFIKKEHLLKTQAFYEKHGGRAIIIARFIPIIRTFAPFIAGVGSMNYSKFISFNLIGGALWVGGITLLGFFFGGFDIVKNNFEIVVFLIIFISILPVIIEFLKHKFSKKKAA
jgi:membrane-associated protein